MKPLINIISECHSKNLGDQAIVRSLYNILHPFYRITETSFSEISVSQSDFSRSFTKLRQPILRRIFKTIPAKTKARIRWHILGEKTKFADHFSAPIQESDLVIVGGGQLVKNNIALFCEKLSLVSSISRVHSTPIALIGVGVDKKMNSQNWRISKKAINEAKFIMLRDTISRDRIYTAINSERNYLVLPDLAFALKNSELDRKSTSRSISLAINVMNLENFLSSLDCVNKTDNRAITAFLSDIVKIAHNNGSTISLFTSGTPDDLHVANITKSEIFAQTGIELPIFHPSTLDDLLSFLADVNDVIAMRMHAGILAFISGCNPLCFNWDDKVAGVWSTIHQPERVIDMKDIAREDVGAQVLKRLQNLTPASRNSLDELAEEIRLGVLEPIGKTLRHNQVTRTLKA
jgi:polysaccharide pyruvyl transferase WcaK-like protein